MAGHWYERIALRSWSRVLRRRYETSLAGVLCAMAGIVLLIAYFALA